MEQTYFVAKGHLSKIGRGPLGDIKALVLVVSDKIFFMFSCKSPCKTCDP